VPVEHATSLPAVELALWKGENLVDRGSGSNVLGSPLVALGHLVALLRAQPGAPPLAAGEIVTTGTLTDAHPVAPDETWRTEISGVALSGLKVRFT
jgi:2-oxo-3-hexenedioate decarboxylase